MALFKSLIFSVRRRINCGALRVGSSIEHSPIMTRTFLCKGDKADEAVITEGLPGNTYSEGEAELELATVYMKTYCHTCKKEGFICPSGPRLPGTTENGKMWALSGDINICNCDPHPVFDATRNYTMTMDGEGGRSIVNFAKQARSTFYVVEQ